MQCFEYKFVQNFLSGLESNSIELRMLYKFRANRSKQIYLVWIDKCIHNVYVIKFHLKNHSSSKRKYNILTNLHEARSVVYTCLMILLNEIYAHDKYASFGFVAANLESEESKENTKRLRFYTTFITTFIGSEVFCHYKYVESSAYLLIPKIAFEKNPNIENEIMNLFQEHDFIEGDNDERL